MMNRRMYMFDFARLRSYHKEEFEVLIALLQKLGYNEIGLYIEGAFLPDGASGAIRDGVITQPIADEMLSIVAAHHITILPMTNVLYHMEHFLCQERYAYLRRKGQTSRYLINYEHAEAVPFAMQIIRTLAGMFRTTKIQIGLDEFPFTKEEIPAIGQYITTVTSSMLAEGLTPAVWGDMFWMEQSLTSYLPRECEIHDWNYYGHRPESIRYFCEEGFAQVIAVPSDNGWEGFTGCQRTTGYLRSRTDIPVDAGEIEAFLSDAKQEGADGGMIANWENTVGRSVWSALVPAARAGLWMRGKWDDQKSEEEQVEFALFDRVTPYTHIVQTLRKLQIHVSEKCHIRLPQDALYRKESMLELLNRPVGFWDDTIMLYEQALSDMDAALDNWLPRSVYEHYAHGALGSVVANIRAALCLMRISQAQTVYREAALQQFLDRGAFISLLDQFRPLFINAICGLQNSIDARLASIQKTGITRQVLLWQNRLIGHLDKILARLDTYRNNPDNIEAICAYTELIYCWEFAEGGYVPQ